MKTSIYILLLMFMINFKSIGQRATKQERISNKTTIRGRHLLRKENRIHNATENLADKNENKERRKHKLGTLSNYKSQKKMVTKERRKAKKEEKKHEKKQEIKAEKKGAPKKESVVSTMGPEEIKE